jgi:integrase
MLSEQPAQALERYERALRASRKAERTVRKYVADIGAFLRYCERRQCAAEQGFPLYAESLRQRYKASTCNSYLISINAFLSFAGLAPFRQPLNRIQRRFSLEHELTKEEYARLLQSALQNREQAFYLIMRALAGTGMRVGELKYITPQAVKRGWAEIALKGKVRQVFFSQRLQEELAGYCQNNGITEGPVFLNKKGTAPLDPSVIWRHLKKTAALAGVDEAKVYAHNLRHLFARVYMETYGDILDLADLLGHSSVETTRIYTRTSSAEKIRRMNLLSL